MFSEVQGVPLKGLSRLKSSQIRPTPFASDPNLPALRVWSSLRGQRKGAQGKKRQKSSKSVKIFSTLVDNFRAAPVFRPLLGASDKSLRSSCFCVVLLLFLLWKDGWPLGEALEPSQEAISAARKTMDFSQKAWFQSYEERHDNYPTLMLGQGCLMALFRRTIYFLLKWV